MAIDDKAPDTPSRIRAPSAKGIASADTENRSDAGNKRKAPVSDQAVKRALTQPPPPQPKISSLSNPRIPNKPGSRTVQQPPVLLPIVRTAKVDPSMNQRLEDMERITKELQEKVGDNSSTLLSSQLQLAESKCAELEVLRQSLEARLFLKEKELGDASYELESTRKKLQSNMEESEIVISRLKTSLAVDYELVQRERDALKRELEQANCTLNIASAELNALKGTVSTQATTIVDLEAHIAAYKSRFNIMEGEVSTKHHLLEQSEDTIAQLNSNIKQLKEKLHIGETARRKLHNDLQELKGNIRVFCRVRPLINAESDDGLLRVPGGHGIGEPEDIVVEQSVESATGNPSLQQHPFFFDKVFSSSTSQAEIFDEIAQLVQSALDGFRVCIFAYGQTGSGKTFTMEGLPNEDNMGVIPRAVHQIFEHAHRLKERGWSFNFQASFLEIYNEAIRDLLNENENKEPVNHEVRHNGTRTLVTDLTIQPVDTVQSVLDLLAVAAKNRAVAETLCNNRSSRSHSVFTLRINGTNSVTSESTEGLLNLIDLAGSERLSSSGSTGDRLKETQAINKSLSSLGDVISAIAAKEAHVPFRNSKLTYLLQHSLGGNSKTLMFVNVSPAAPSIPETLCSLRFATKVNSCHIGTARRNVTK